MSEKPSGGINANNINYLQKFSKATPKGYFSSIEFQESGSYFAAGDNSGKIWMYKNKTDDSYEDTAKRNNDLFEYYGKFQSHERGFDYLHSQEISDQICILKWLPRYTQSLQLISANDKTIKLWKIYERMIFENKAEKPSDQPEDLKIPDLNFKETLTAVSLEKEFRKAHVFHINSVSLNADRETFLSADDLRIYIWNLRNPNEAYNIVDLKPHAMENLHEVITTVNFHPADSNVFIYGTNEGTIKYNDIRLSSNCDHSFREFGKVSGESLDNMTSAISDFKFLPCGNMIIARDYVSIKKWDIRHEKKPVGIVSLDKEMSPHLGDLFENDKIFDKFSLVDVNDGRNCITGTYGKNLMCCDLQEEKMSLVKFGKKGCKESQLESEDFNERVLDMTFNAEKKALLLAYKHKIMVMKVSI